MGFIRKECWSWLPFSSSEHLPNPGIELMSPVLAGGFFTAEPQGVQFISVTQLYLTLCDPMHCSMPGFPVHHQHTELAQTHVHRVSDATQPSFPLSSPLLLPSIFPSIRVFSNESVPRIRWSKYWSFSFSNRPCNEYSGLISLRID